MVDRWHRSSRSRSPSTAQNPSASPASGARCWGTSYRRPRRGSPPGTTSIARCRLSVRVQRSPALIPRAWARGCSSSASPKARSSRTGCTLTCGPAPGSWVRSAWPRSRPSAHDWSRSARYACGCCCRWRQRVVPRHAGRRGQRVLPRLSGRQPHKLPAIPAAVPVVYRPIACLVPGLACGPCRQTASGISRGGRCLSPAVPGGSARASLRRSWRPALTFWSAGGRRPWTRPRCLRRAGGGPFSARPMSGMRTQAERVVNRDRGAVRAAGCGW